MIGSRSLSLETTMEISKIRKVAMWILAATASRAVGTRITDATSGFRVIVEPLLSEFSENFASNYLGDTYEAVIAAGRAGYIVREVPAQMGPRLVGESTASSGKAFALTVRCGFVYLLHLHLRLRKRVTDSTSIRGDV